jgi:hypothetical protein
MQTFDAHASAWGVEGNVGSASTQRFASYRAMIVRDVYEIDDTTAMRRAPNDAVYYPARIYFGHIYEVVLSGTENSFNAGVAAELAIVTVGIQQFAHQHDLKLQAMGRGLAPKDERAIFARTEREIQNSYKADGGAAVPILVEWRIIPGRSARQRPIEWKSLEKGCAGETGCEPCQRWSFVSIEYTAPGSKSSGNAWDADGSPPDLALSIRVGPNPRGTPKQQDRSTARWDLDPPIEADTNETIMVVATDADLMVNDPVANVSEKVPATLPGGVFTFGAGSTTLSGVCIEGGNP